MIICYNKRNKYSGIFYEPKSKPFTTSTTINGVSKTISYTATATATISAVSSKTSKQTSGYSFRSF
ncbi:MAG: hypothetical protein A2458_04905 [Candidatus Kerfeldbacteria bacterium RIFOXYC2_FULL_38_9]|nr:MAG: hypothetical protein A2458_04905 [Candidatus Kerfeldbacteria bacterium RIFOXYC2_FULL_38_9]